MRSLDAFPDFYAVVLEHPGGGPLRWSPAHEGWLRPVEGGWADEPVADDRIREYQLDAAVEAVETFLAGSYCPRCIARPRADLHYVTVGVIGDPAIYCLHEPAYEVVGSAQDTGALKHWGAPSGCQSVGGPSLHMASVPGIGRSIVAGYVHGRPLPPDEVMGRPWCKRCRRAAFHVLAGSDDSDTVDAIREVHITELRSLARLLTETTD